MAKKFRLPKEVLIYQCDTLDDGSPVYGVTESVEGIPEDSHGDIVGVYYLNTENEFRVKRELKLPKGR